jgi:hypothetical protein
MAAATYPRMTEAEATAWVMLECQATTEPCLTTEEVQHLVNRARRADADGNPPSDAAWDPSWDLNWAAWRGWRMKASKAVLMVDVTGDGTTVSKSQVYSHCMAQANDYARGVTQVVNTQPDLGDDAITSPESNATTSIGPGSLEQPGTIPGVTYP